VEEKTVTLESGVTLKQITNEAWKKWFGFTPYWYGLTIGGMIGTGAHWSTLWGKGSSIHYYVVEIRIVRPQIPKMDMLKLRFLMNKTIWRF